MFFFTFQESSLDTEPSTTLKTEQPQVSDDVTTNATENETDQDVTQADVDRAFNHPVSTY